MDDVHFLSCVLDTSGAYDPLLLDYMFLILHPGMSKSGLKMDENSSTFAGRLKVENTARRGRAGRGREYERAL